MFPTPAEREAQGEHPLSSNRKGRKRKDPTVAIRSFPLGGHTPHPLSDPVLPYLACNFLLAKTQTERCGFSCQKKDVVRPGIRAGTLQESYLYANPPAQSAPLLRTRDSRPFTCADAGLSQSFLSPSLSGSRREKNPKDDGNRWPHSGRRR